MASVTHRDSYPALANYFSPAEQQRLIEDDLRAGRSVSGVLISVITTGMIVGIITVAAIVFLS